MYLICTAYHSESLQGYEFIALNGLRLAYLKNRRLWSVPFSTEGLALDSSVMTFKRLWPGGRPMQWWLPLGEIYIMFGCIPSTPPTNCVNFAVQCWWIVSGFWSGQRSKWFYGGILWLAARNKRSKLNACSDHPLLLITGNILCIK